jgi:hypothetical protein
LNPVICVIFYFHISFHKTNCAHSLGYSHTCPRHTHYYYLPPSSSPRRDLFLWARDHLFSYVTQLALSLSLSPPLSYTHQTQSQYRPTCCFTSVVSCAPFKAASLRKMHHFQYSKLFAAFHSTSSKRQTSNRTNWQMHFNFEIFFGSVSRLTCLVLFCRAILLKRLLWKQTH